MIINAKDLKPTEEYLRQEEETITSIMNDIGKAVAKGRRKCHFSCYPYQDNYYAVRSKFEEQGYQIVPTGYIGGVWQTTESITW